MFARLSGSCSRQSGLVFECTAESKFAEHNRRFRSYFFLRAFSSMLLRLSYIHELCIVFFFLVMCNPASRLALHFQICKLIINLTNNCLIQTPNGLSSPSLRGACILSSFTTYRILTPKNHSVPQQNVHGELYHNVLLLRAVGSLTAKVLMSLYVLTVAIWGYSAAKGGDIGPLACK